MTTITLHENAKKDIRLIASNDAKAAGWLSAILKEMRDNEDLNDALLTNNEDVELGDMIVNTLMWSQQQYGRQRHLWRLKPFVSLNRRTLPYRIIYAYRSAFGNFPAEIHVLGVFLRSLSDPANSFDYDESNKYAQRVISDYEQLD